jgi:hypothetical protein
MGDWQDRRRVSRTPRGGTVRYTPQDWLLSWDRRGINAEYCIEYGRYKVTTQRGGGNLVLRTYYDDTVLLLRSTLYVRTLNRGPIGRGLYLFGFRSAGTVVAEFVGNTMLTTQYNENPSVFGLTVDSTHTMDCVLYAGLHPYCAASMANDPTEVIHSVSGHISSVNCQITDFPQYPGRLFI